MLFTHQDLKEEKKKKRINRNRFSRTRIICVLLVKNLSLRLPTMLRVRNCCGFLFTDLCLFMVGINIKGKQFRRQVTIKNISQATGLPKVLCYFHGGGGGRSECTCSKYWGEGGGDISPCLGPDMDTVSVIRLNAPCTPSKTAACGFRCVTLVTVSVAWSRDKEQAQVWSAPDFLTPNQPDVFIFILVVFSHNQRWLKWHHSGPFIRPHTAPPGDTTVLEADENVHEAKVRLL